MSPTRPVSSLSATTTSFGDTREEDVYNNGGDTSSPSLKEISLKLSTLQAALANFSPQQQPQPVYFYPPHHSTYTFPGGGGPPPQDDPLLSSPVIKSQVAQLSQMQISLGALKAELSTLKTTLSHLGASSGVCSGAMALTSLLLAISFVAIIIIILASLGLAGVLPQFTLLLEGHTNLIWAIVSASIVTVICLISVLCVTLIRHKPDLQLSSPK